ncbi:hypothetical protein EC973_000243 [Apophysomyces ossiformis]|uniref:MACPF-like domain-containing protein n=1 Tax=Apophysomyces ossiformis TaxID=679940 RepID=A0A8H7BUU6_9FUNG|nr:hypothetical protein EC973_000243 [Apophysomyces ossiformis]
MEFLRSLTLRSTPEPDTRPPAVVREANQVISRECRHGLLPNGDFAQEEAIRVLDKNDPDFLNIRKQFESVELISLEVDWLQAQEVFNSNLRIDLLPDIAFFRAGAGLGWKDQNQNSANIRNEKRRMGIHMSRAEICLNRRTVCLTEAFQAAITDALSTPRYIDKHQQLEQLFGKYGYCYPSIIWIGGSATYEATTFGRSNRRIQENERQAQAAVGTHGVGTETSALMTQIHFRVQMEAQTNSTFRITGGDPDVFLESGLRGWTATIDDNPGVILLKNIRPIYELLPSEEQQREIRRVYDVARNPGFILLESMVNIYYHKHPSRRIRVLDIDQSSSTTTATIPLAYNATSHNVRILCSDESSSGEVKIRLVPKAHAAQPCSPYFQYNQIVYLEVIDDEPRGRIYATGQRIRIPFKPQKYMITAVYPSHTSVQVASEEWKIVKSKQAPCEDSNNVRQDDRIIFQNMIENSKYYLCLTSQDKLWEKLCNNPSKRHCVAARETIREELYWRIRMTE